MPTFLGDAGWLVGFVAFIVIIAIIVQGVRVNSQMHNKGKGNNGNGSNNNNNNNNTSGGA
jgi:hypothetical protein